MFKIISDKRLKALEDKLQTVIVELEALHRDYDRLNDSIHEEISGAKEQLEDIK
jgi:prefoldin subunit 5